MKLKIGLVAILLCMLLIVGLIFASRQPDITRYHPQSDRIQQGLKDRKLSDILADYIPSSTVEAASQSVKEAPKISIQNYVMDAPEPSLPADVQIYSLKSSFGDHDVQLLMTQLIGQDPKLVLKKSNDTAFAHGSFGALALNTQTGAYQFEGIGVKVPFEVSLSSVQTDLENYLQTSNIIDPTVHATAYYKRDSSPHTLYVEFHRDWNAVGLPIVNPVSAGGLDPKTPISSLSFTTFSNVDTPDNSIIFASDRNGFARRSDFNTLTVGLSDSGHIVSLVSNIRPIESSQKVSDRGLNLLSTQEILKELTSDGSYFNLTLPAGEGVLDLTKVYPGNTLSAKTGTITDISLIYEEKPVGIFQKYLSPMYLVRGFAESETGIRVTFSQAVPALNDPEYAEKPSLMKKIAQLLVGSVFAQSSYQCNGQTVECKQETFKTTPIPTQPFPTPTTTQTIPTRTSPSIVTPPPTSTPGTVIPTLPIQEPCTLSDQQGNIVERGQEFHVTGLGTVVYFQTLSRLKGPLTVKIGSPAYLPGEDMLFEPQFGSGTLTRGLEFEEMIDNHISALGAQIILDHPEKEVHLTSGVLDLNALFSDYHIDMDLNNASVYWASSTIDWKIRQAIYGYNGWSLQKLAAQPKQFGSVPIAEIFYARRPFQNGALYDVNTDTRSYQGYVLDPRCQFRSVISPNIYIYPTSERRLTLTFDHAKVVYADPYLSNDLTFEADPSGKLTFYNSHLDHIHYEYDGSRVTFEKPVTGWSIPTDTLDTFLKNLSSQLKLQTAESDDLIKDVHASLLGKLKEQNMFIGIIPEDQISAQLPFHLNEQPSTLRRIHLYVQYEQKHMSYPQPTIEPILRHGYTVIELGVYVH